MYTSYIGKKFLKLYNERKKTDYTPEQFFDHVFFELFFTDEGHLMHVGNSPFFQKPKADDVAIHGSVSLAQRANLKHNIQNDVPNMSIYVGASAKDIGGTTSGQVSSIPIEVDSDEMYASWIGAALAIGVNGGLVMLLEHPEILWRLYQGWAMYRKYLTNTPNIKDRQIETWNGHWICFSLSAGFDEQHLDEGWEINAEPVQGNIAIPTVKWSSVIFALSKSFPYTQMTAYVYSLSQTNTTLGFINLYLKEIHTLYDMWDQLILESDQTILSDTEIAMFLPFYSFKDACAFGTIGLKAMEPAKLREFMPKGSVKYAQGKDYKFKDTASYAHYKLFKIWIYAMLNKTEIIQLADQLASILMQYDGAPTSESRGKSDKKAAIKQVIESRYLKEFAENVRPLLTKENSTALKEIVAKSYVEIASDNFPLFLTLVRFQYQVLQINS